MNYEYPLMNEWNVEEVICVVEFYQLVEKAYEEGINKEELLLKYNDFRNIVNAKSIEKELGKEFEKNSGYSIYQVIKKAKSTDDLIIRM